MDKEILKEAIELLEKNSRILEVIYEEKEIPMPDDLEKLSINNAQALVLFRKAQEQPPASEFTNRKWKHTVIIKTEDRDELCDRLDASEASQKELLKTGEDLLSVLGKGGYFPAAGKPRTDAFRAAIAKAKKEG